MSAYVCRFVDADGVACRWRSPTWFARCGECGEYGTAIPLVSSGQASTMPPSDPASPTALSVSPSAQHPHRSVPVPLTDVPENSFMRWRTGLTPLDDVLGGGLVVGSAVAIVAGAGVGKSSCWLQALAGIRETALYATGEETTEQIAATSRRINADVISTLTVRETNVDAIIDHVREQKIRILVVDSVQMMYCSDLKGAPGSPSQLTESVRRFVALKDNGVTVCLISQVTNDGDAKGGTFLPHLVDVVLEMTVIPVAPETRMLRCPYKNRFGATNVTGYMTMTKEGLVPATKESIRESLDTGEIVPGFSERDR